MLLALFRHRPRRVFCEKHISREDFEDISTIGMEKIHRIMNETPVISFQNGILTIKDTALDLDKEDDVRYHGELQKQFF